MIQLADSGTLEKNPPAAAFRSDAMQAASEVRTVPSTRNWRDRNKSPADQPGFKSSSAPYKLL